MHTYESLKAALVSEATKHGEMFPGNCFQASVGPHSVLLHIRRSGARYMSMKFGMRATREQLDAALAQVPADMEIYVERASWN